MEEPVGWTPNGDRTDYYITPYRVGLGAGKLQLTKLPLEQVCGATDEGGFGVPFYPVLLGTAFVLAGASLWVMRRWLIRQAS
jgi:hypothetical protein